MDKAAFLRELDDVINRLKGIRDDVSCGDEEEDLEDIIGTRLRDAACDLQDLEDSVA